MGTGDNLRRYSGDSSTLNERSLGPIVPTNPIASRELRAAFGFQPCTPLIYCYPPLLNYSDLPSAGFPFDELRDEATSQDPRAIVVIGVSIFRYTSTFEVVRRRAKPLVLSKGARIAVR